MNLDEELRAYTKACQRPERGAEHARNEFVTDYGEQVKGAIVAACEKRMSKGHAPQEIIRDMYYKLLDYGERINTKDKAK